MTPSRSRQSSASSFKAARLFPAAALIAALCVPVSLSSLAPQASAETVATETEQQSEAQAKAQTETKAKTENETEATEQTETSESVSEEQASGSDETSDQTSEDAAEDKSDADAEAKDKPKKPKKTEAQLKAEAEAKELKELQRQAQLRSARLAAELAPLNEEKSRIEAELSLLKTKQQEAQAKAELKKQAEDFKQQIKLAEMSRELRELQQQYQQLQVQTQIDQLKRAAESAELSAIAAQRAAEASALQSEVSLVSTKRSVAGIDIDEMRYPANPLKGKTLTISDRRIPLNGAIGRGTADYVTERIHYYNNLSDKAPIFIVIDSSPGGSVMEGFRIVTAMKNSDAPVYVVVKSFAASMAAVITTLADDSYAYPNAILLHHQMSSGLRGNLTQQQEALEEAKEWSDRLAVPVAEKMGVSYDEFVKLMYKNNSDGDWAEFADKAKQLKWVNHIVHEIRETALVTAPRSRQAAPMIFFEGQEPATQTPGSLNPAAELPPAFTQYELFNPPVKYPTKSDGNGNTYTELPPLEPFDYYFMHDPNQRYRIAK